MRDAGRKEAGPFHQGRDPNVHAGRVGRRVPFPECPTLGEIAKGDRAPRHGRVFESPKKGFR